MASNINSPTVEQQLKRAGKRLSQLGGWFPGTMEHVQEQPKNVPAAQDMVKYIEEQIKNIDCEKAGPAIPGTIVCVGEENEKISAAVQGTVTHIQEQYNAIEWDKAPLVLRTWIETHPYQTAFLVANGVIILVPGVLSTPVLAVLGWGGAGVRVGSIAAGVQSAIGNVGAGSAFAYVQSAAMGGYGAGAVAGAVRVGALIAGGLGVWRRSEGEGEEREERGEEEGGEVMKAAEGEAED